MQQTPFSLTPAPPFDFRKTLDFLAGFKASAVDRRFEPQAFAQALQVDGELLVVRLEQAGNLDNPRLEGDLYSSTPLSDGVVKAATDRIRFFLSLDDDLRPFYRAAELDDAFQPVLRKLYGHHLVKYTTPFECACWALVTQRTPNSFAYKTMRRLVDAFGQGLERGGTLYRGFPEPLELLGHDPDGSPKARAKILEATNNTRKADRLLDVAKAFSIVDGAFLRTAPYNEVHKWLKSVKGLGIWSADTIMLRGLGRTERLPWSDTRLVDVVSQVYAGGLSLSRQDIKVLAESYGAYQGYWLHYLKLAS